MTTRKLNRILLVAATLLLAGAVAYAQRDSRGLPDITNWIQDPATPIAQDVRDLGVVTSLVLAPFLFGPLIVLGYIVWRFSSKRNPVPAKFHDNVPLEVGWTIVPAMVLVFTALISYPLSTRFDNPPQSDVVLNVTGHQFYFTYEFPRYGVTHTDDGTGNNPLVVPAGKYVTMNGQASQVNHAWWVPAFGIKFDVIPGRISHGWFKVDREGLYKGQCAELCGTGHAIMLIYVKVVSDEEFKKWILEKNPEAVFDETTVADASTTAAAAQAPEIAMEAVK
ncbi:MAG: cytochrome c oxidase subunit II [Candidatus Sumerlaeia bacterium]|nr:cytochrome c oxidase subunit II [Candidatus Sumerlaeia bacterium]